MNIEIDLEAFNALCVEIDEDWEKMKHIMSLPGWDCLDVEEDQ